MSQKIGTVIIDVKADTAKLVSGMDRAEKTVKRSVNNIKNTIIGMATAYAGIASINAFSGMITSSIDAADNLNKFSEKLAISSTELSRLEYAAGYADVTMGDLNASMSAMIRRTENFKRDGTGAASKAMADLGISASTARKEFTDTNTTFLYLLNKLDKVEDKTKRTAIAQDLFSKSAAKVVLLAGMGGDEIKRLGDEGERLGAVFSEDMTKSSEIFNDQLMLLDKTMGGFANNLTESMLPSLIEMTKVLEGTSKYSETIDTIEEMSVAVFGTVVAVKTYTIAARVATASNALYGGSFGAVNRSILLATVSTRALSLATKAIPYVALASSIYTMIQVIDSMHDSLSIADRSMQDFKKSTDDAIASTINFQLAELEKQQVLIKASSRKEAKNSSVLGVATISPHYRTLMNELTELALKIKILKTKKEDLFKESKSNKNLNQDTNNSTKKGSAGNEKERLKLAKLTFKAETDAKKAIADYNREVFESIEQASSALNDYNKQVADTYDKYMSIVGSDYDVWITETGNKINALGASGELTGVQLKNVYDILSADFQVSQALDSSTFDGINDAMLDIYESMNDIWNTDQMEDFFKKWNGGIEKVSKTQSKGAITQTDSLGTVQGMYSNLTGVMGTFYDKDDDRRNKQAEVTRVLNLIQMTSQFALMAQSTAFTSLFVAQEALKAQAAGTTAVAIAAQSSPWTGLATAAAMIAMLASIGIMLSGGGGGSEAPIDPLQTKLEDLALSNEPMLEKLDSQISLLEKIEKNGSASQANLERAGASFNYEFEKFQLETAINIDGSAVDAQDQGTLAVNTKINELNIFAKELKSSYGIILDANISTANGDRDLYYSLRGMIDTKDEFIAYLANRDEIEALRKDTLVTATRTAGSEEIMSDIEFQATLDEAKTIIYDFANAIGESVEDLKDLRDTFESIFDDITLTTFYEDTNLSNAFGDVNKILEGTGDSLDEYLTKIIDPIRDLEEEYSSSVQQLLLSTDSADLANQIELTNTLANLSNTVYENGARDALDFVESIELVAEAMSTSSDNIKDWKDSFKTDTELTQDMADIAGVTLAITMDELNSLFTELSTDTFGLTVSDMELLEANRDLIDSYMELIDDLKSFADDLLLTTLDDEAGYDYAMAMFDESILRFSTAVDQKQAVEDIKTYANNAITYIGNSSSSLADENYETASIANTIKDLAIENDIGTLKSVEDAIVDLKDAVVAELQDIKTNTETDLVISA